MANKMPEVGGKKKESSALLTCVCVSITLYMSSYMYYIHYINIQQIRNIVILSFIYILFSISII